MKRTVFLVSDGTGITAEAFGQSMMNQFEVEPTFVRMPFTDSIDKAHKVAQRINRVSQHENNPAIIFSTIVNPEIVQIIKDGCSCLLLDTFGTFLKPLEQELKLKSNHRVGRFADVAHSNSYNARIEAINFSLEHDDGQTDRNLAESDVILIGVSRSGKTPTSLYLAMQYGIKTANYPLIPEDFDRNQLPGVLRPFQKKLFGLSIDPRRLSEIRQERRPNSKYASLENCRFEVSAAEHMMRVNNIRWLHTTNRSIEEISTTILQALKFDNVTT